VRDGNNPFEGDFDVGIVERCTHFLGVVGWRKKELSGVSIRHGGGIRNDGNSGM
jgi:hypothetical protein